MLRRIPTTADGQAADRLQESTRVNKPFKPPAFANARESQPQRKRKRVSYKEQRGDGSDSEAERSRKKQKKTMDKDGIYHNEEELRAAIPKYPVYSVKPFHELGSRRFSLPSMTSKDGRSVQLVASNASLGVRPPTKVPPRPLHDPMEDHAIVLYDPTIDGRETDEERKEREKEEAKERVAKEAQEKLAGKFNPHKSLRSLLGEGTNYQKMAKVPVVIDPKLSKVLRPHQVEGVKVNIIFPPHVSQISMIISSFTSVPQVWWLKTNMDALWPTRWDLARLCSALHLCGLCSSNHRGQESQPSRSALLPVPHLWSRIGRMN
jgi:DNA repair and recombination RAD54-like protein